MTALSSRLSKIFIEAKDGNGVLHRRVVFVENWDAIPYKHQRAMAFAYAMRLAKDFLVQWSFGRA